MKTSAGRNLMSTQEYFSSLQQPTTPRSSFDRGCEVMTTFDAGLLIPLYWDEVLPSDTWNVSQSLFGRITTLIKPLMDNLYLDIHWFYVPNRLLQAHWVNIMGEQDDPENPVSYSVAQIEFDTEATPTPSSAVVSQSLAQYLGIPNGTDKTEVSIYPFRAYKKIYDDFYRDENFIAKTLPASALGDATEIYTTENFPLYRRGKRKDYFTSALPWAQKGTPPTLAFSGTASITGTLSGTVDTRPKFLGTPDHYISQLDTQATSGSPTATWATTPVVFSGNSPTTATRGYGFDAAKPVDGLSIAGLDVDLTDVSGFTLNAFREFATIQQYLELDARGGTRYVEHLWSFFGVQPEDARLQRAEYLGGQTFDLMVTPIAQTSATDAGTPQANLAGMGTFAANGHQFVKSFTEDGVIMAIGSVRAEQRYQQGIPKKWSRKTRYDFYRPVFANLGEQPIFNREIFVSGTATDDEVFGYQEAWAEYRYSPSIITGKMVSDDPVSLDSWHLAVDFADTPILGKTFIEESPPMSRVLAVEDEPAFMLNGRFNLNVARPMPMRSIPGLTRL